LFLHVIKKSIIFLLYKNPKVGSCWVGPPRKFQNFVCVYVYVHIHALGWGWRGEVAYEVVKLGGHFALPFYSFLPRTWV